MSGVVRGLVCVGLISSSAVARAESPAPGAAPAKAQRGKATSTAPAAPAVKPAELKAPNGSPGPATAAKASSSAALPSASTSTSSTVEAPSSPGSASSEEPSAPGAKAASDAPAPAAVSPKAAPAVPTVRVYMRSGTEPLRFSARATDNHGTPTLCVAPCDAKLPPGDYQLRLNGVVVDGPVKLARPGTLEGKLESREASREGGWLALNVGGILGGVFITVAALGGPSWTYVAGGGSLLSGGVIFVLTYRADRASVSFSPNEPADVRGLPPPLPTDNNSSGPTPSGSFAQPDHRLLPFSQARGLGIKITF